MTYYSNFTTAYSRLCLDMKNYSQEIHTETWQALDIKDRPEAEMRELIHTYFGVLLLKTDLDHWREDIQPNLPWADDHFEQERVSGHPVNPGETWKQWPWALSADKHRTEGEQFSHSYAERYWPKHAGYTPDGLPDGEPYPHRAGIRYPYGSLDDLVALLRRHPYTRQGYLPVWFPEDTGAVHGERVPCTLGYHFLLRNKQLHTHYSIRSCDLVRHLRDDWYLTVRLTLWILDQLKATPEWFEVIPGQFTMWIGSLHCFTNDFRQL